MADTIEEQYKNGLTEEVGTAQGQSTYDYLRSASAKELVDSNIQMSIARQNSARALNSYMNGLGLGGSGYAGVQATGIQNAYLNGLAANEQQYANSINDIATQEANELSNDMSVLGTNLSNAGSEEEMDKYLANHGLVAVKDNNGNVTGFAGSMWDKLSDSQRATLMDYYTIGKSNTTSGTDSEGYSHMSDALNSWTMENGQNVNIGNGYGLQDELKYIFSGSYMNNAKDGMVVSLTNGNAGDTNHMFVVFKNGKWYRTDSATFERARKQGNYDSITGGKSVKSLIEAYNI